MPIDDDDDWYFELEIQTRTRMSQSLRVAKYRLF